MRHCLANDPERFRPRLLTLRSWGAGLAILLCCALGMGKAQDATEYQVKAAYLFNFAKSAEWPEHSLPNGAPLVIGVLGGDDEFIDTLQKTVAGRTAGTHSITIRRADSEADMGVCHIIFFRSSAGHKRTEAAIVSLTSASILLVGEEDGFLRRGGMIDLVLKNGTVRFEVDQATLGRANIHLGPELLAVALGRRDHGSSNGTSGELRRLKVGPLPEYPEVARRLNIRGMVQVEASVRRDGTVKEVRVIGGHPLLADALVKAVREWRYEPAAKDSQVVVKFVFEP